MPNTIGAGTARSGAIPGARATALRVPPSRQGAWVLRAAPAAACRSICAHTALGKALHHKAERAGASRRAHCHARGRDGRERGSCRLPAPPYAGGLWFCAASHESTGSRLIPPTPCAVRDAVDERSRGGGGSHEREADVEQLVIRPVVYSRYVDGHLVGPSFSVGRARGRAPGVRRTPRVW